MKDETHTRRKYLALLSSGTLAASSGCLDRIPFVGNDDREGPPGVDRPTEEDIDIQQRTQDVQNEIIQNDVLANYETGHLAVLNANTVDVEAEVTREVDIGDARVYRISAEVDLDHNAEDLEGFVRTDREELMEKLSQPSYDMTEVVYRHLEQYDAEERNVHQTRIETYQTVFHGDNDSFVRYRRSSGQLRDLETREAYMENFQDNAQVRIDDDWF